MKSPLLIWANFSRIASSRSWVRGFVAVLEIALVLCLAWLASNLVLQYLKDDTWQLPVVATRLPSNTDATSVPGKLSFDPFYRTPAVAAGPQKVTPESRMNLKVHGLRSDGTGAGSAILQAGGEPQKLVKVGDIITGSVTLEGVYSDRIEIKRAGVLEAIYMSADAPKRTKPTGAPVPYKAAKNTVAVPSNLLSIISGMALTPMKEGRRINGFIVGETASPANLSLLGLEAGDILLAVGDTDLTSFERLNELPEELAGEKEIILHYERRGEKRSLRLDLE